VNTYRYYTDIVCLLFCGENDFITLSSRVAQNTVGISVKHGGKQVQAGRRQLGMMPGGGRGGGGGEERNIFIIVIWICAACQS